MGRREADVASLRKIPLPARLRAGLARPRRRERLRKISGAVPASTVGYERLFSWWGSHAQNNDEEGFVDSLLEGQPDAPAYFGRMKRQNKRVPALLDKRSELRRYDRRRSRRSCVAVTYSCWIRGAWKPTGMRLYPELCTCRRTRASSWAAWVIDPEQERRPIVLLAKDEANAEKQSLAEKDSEHQRRRRRSGVGRAGLPFTGRVALGVRTSLAWHPARAETTRPSLRRNAQRRNSSVPHTMKGKTARMAISRRPSAPVPNTAWSGGR